MLVLDVHNPSYDLQQYVDVLGWVWKCISSIQKHFQTLDPQWNFTFDFFVSTVAITTLFLWWSSKKLLNWNLLYYHTKVCTWNNVPFGPNLIEPTRNMIQTTILTLYSHVILLLLTISNGRFRGSVSFSFTLSIRSEMCISCVSQCVAQIARTM